jgi:hypothetical protein
LLIATTALCSGAGIRFSTGSRLAPGIGQDRRRLADMLGSGGDGDAKLRHQSASPVDQHGALLDQPPAHPRLRGGRLLRTPAAACLTSLLTAAKHIAGRLTGPTIAATDQVCGLKADALAASFLFRRT